jgi:hypothetical protein
LDVVYGYQGEVREEITGEALREDKFIENIRQINTKLRILLKWETQFGYN